MTFTDARALAVRARDKAKGYRWVNNTRLIDRTDHVVVSLHGTHVVKIHDDGHYTLDSGGYHTLTTRDRMNRVTPRHIRIIQKKYKWWVLWGPWRVPYTDGMRVY